MRGGVTLAEMHIRFVLAALSVLLAASLIAGLIAYSDARLSDIKRAILATPIWLVGAIVALTAINQWLGVKRWQVANRWFAQGEQPTTTFKMFEATTWGALLGQFLPPQISMTSARWIATRKNSSIGVTLYEQLFDIVILGAGGLAAIALLLSSASPVTAFAVFIAIVAAGCLSIRFAFRIGHRIAVSYANSELPLNRLAARVAKPLDQASEAPAKILVNLTMLSTLRMALLAVRLIIIAAIFLPGVEMLLIAIGYPVVGIASAVPFLPGGLGLAEWSLTGLLVYSGSHSAAAAAITAIMVRLIVLASLVVLTVALVPLSRISTSANRDSERSSVQA